MLDSASDVGTAIKIPKAVLFWKHNFTYTDSGRGALMLADVELPS